MADASRGGRADPMHPLGLFLMQGGCLARSVGRTPNSSKCRTRLKCEVSYEQQSRTVFTERQLADPRSRSWRAELGATEFTRRLALPAKGSSSCRPADGVALGISKRTLLRGFLRLCGDAAASQMPNDQRTLCGRRHSSLTFACLRTGVVLRAPPTTGASRPGPQRARGSSRLLL
jgi:hypothetical protein